MSDRGPAADSSAPQAGAPPETTLAEAWGRSLALTYLIVLATAALAIELGWTVIESAFDVRQLFR